jgi:hypothetical protein
MTLEEAIAEIEKSWKAIAEADLGYKIAFFEAIEYPWGWSILYFPVDPTLPMECDEYAADRLLGIVSPVGSKGLHYTEQLFMEWRAKRGIVDGNDTAASTS